MLNTKRFVITWFALVLLITGCAKVRPKCAIATLILDESVFPEGTQLERLISPVSEKPEKSVARSFYYFPSDVFQMVINWDSAIYAKTEFNDYLETAFDTDKYMGPWETPNEIYSSQIADNYHVACGTVHKIYQCRLAATYGEYSVYLRADVADPGISQLEINQLLKAIDERMGQCVN